VGMSTNIPPHNLGEVCDALVYMLENWEKLDDIGVPELMRFIKGPDFPTGGIVYRAEGATPDEDSLQAAYAVGRGKITVRAKVHLEDMGRGRSRIIITELPFQVNKINLIERIAELAQSGKVEGMSDLRDESDRQGLRVVVELSRTADPAQVLAELFKLTPLQTTFSIIMLALVDGEPRTLGLKQALRVYLDHRLAVVRRRSEYDLARARERAHILEGLLTALDNLDQAIDIIRRSRTVETARRNLRQAFNLSEIQAQAILDMQLRRLAALERKKLLAHPKKILDLIRIDLNEMAAKYGDDRRTRIAPDADTDLSDEALVQDEPVFVSITQRGYIKRVNDKTYRSQNRGGRGVLGQSVREEDEIAFFLRCNTLGTILFFSDKGKVYSERVYQIPDESRQGRGIPLVNIISVDPDEMITAVLPVPDFRKAEFCTMATRQGKVKRVALSEFESVRPSGLAAIKIEEGDRLGWVCLTTGKNEIILVTKQGNALRYDENEIRAMGRTAVGVTGIRFKGDDCLAGMEVLEEGGYLLVMSEKGYGKRTPLSEYSAKSRGGLGIASVTKDAYKKIGYISAARVVQEKDEVTIISSGGIVLRLRVVDISVQGRATKGVSLMKLEKDDTIAAVARITEV